MKKEKMELKKKFLYLLEKPLFFSRLTKDLYLELHTKGNMIAHFNREGFHKARFWNLRDFDQTIKNIRTSKNLKYLLQGVDLELIARARFQVAASEFSICSKQAELLKLHCKELQSQFIPKMGDL